MTQIVGFAGKKQSGKNTCCNAIVALKLMESGVSRIANLDQDGEIQVTDVFGETVPGKEWFLFKKPYVNTDAVINDMNSVRIYALADTLKDVAINVLGLPRDKVYGTDKDKSELTHLMWENMPGVTTNPHLLTMGAVDMGCKTFGVEYHDPGRMTIREVLQFMGTEIFRKMYETVWVDSLIRRIDQDKPDLALVCDVRFDNEIILLKEKGAIIVGLEKDVFKSGDTHASEQVNLELCHKIIQNGYLSIVDQNREVYLALHQMKCKNLDLTALDN